jgi:hypothetical protein
VRSDSAEFFGCFLPKKVTTRKSVLNTALCLRHGMGRDAPVLGWMAGRESRAPCVAPDSCPAVFCLRRYTKSTKEECVAMEVVVVGTYLRHVLSACGVENPRDTGVKDDLSIHVLKDVAISSGPFT